MKLIRTFRGYRAPVFSVVVLPDDRFALSASEDHTAKFWDLEREDAVRTLEFSTSVTAVSLGRDGLVLTVDRDGQLAFVDSTTGELRAQESFDFGELTCLASDPSVG